MTPIVVIGGGIIGSAIAYALSRRGQAVTVLTGDDPPPSTSAALGVLHAVSSKQATGAVLDLRLQSWQLWQTWLPQLGIEAQHGIIKLIPAAELPSWEATLAARAAAGLRLEVLQPHDLELIPDDYVALTAPDDLQIDPLTALQALRRHAIAQGADFRAETVLTLTRQGDRITEVITAQQHYTPTSVVLAAGVASQTLAAQCGLDLPLQAVKGTAIEVWAPDWQPPLLASPECNWVPRPDGSVWIGATVDFHSTTSTPTLAEIQTLLQHTSQILPALAHAQWGRAWSGYRPRPQRQRAPILGHALPNLLIATGHYRNGILLAPITAAVISDLLCGGTTDCVEPEFFLPRLA